jgi:predicted HTH transcriptional regulator
MDAEELIRTLRQGEGPRVEFKEDFPPQADEVAKHISALANSGGGVLLMGVADDGTLPGILEPDEVMNRLAGLAQSLSPSPEIEIDAFHLSKSLTIVYARVFPCIPCFYNGRFYRRVGSSSRLCSGEQAARILSSHPSREAKHDLDHADGFRKMIDEGYTVEQLAQTVKKRPTYIRDLLLLLKMPEAARQAFRSGVISKHIGVLIGTIPDEKRRALSFSRRCSPVGNMASQ